MIARPNAIVYICDSCLTKARTLRIPRIRTRSGARCRRTEPHRGYATSEKTKDTKDLENYWINRQPPLEEPTEAGLLPLGQRRRLIELSGPDTPKFLQGLITNNVDASQRDPYYAAFLDARGRVLWDVFVWPTQLDGWGCFIEIDAKEVDDVLRHLKRHKLRSKVAINASPAKEVWAAWGEEDYLRHSLKILPDYIPDPRAPGFGYRFLQEPVDGQIDNENLAMWKASDLLMSLAEYDLRRYLFGIAEGQSEIERGVALPMDYNIDLSSGIDFRKGCYVGQELTIRTKHTGVVRKRVLPVQLYSSISSSTSTDEAPAFDRTIREQVHRDISGTNIRQVDDKGKPKRGTPAGKLLARIDNVGLALCRLENMTPMRVSAEGGTYIPGAQFKIFEGTDGEPLETPVGVRAYVPPWLREREKALWDKGRQRKLT
ncbi:Aminomethyltransferase folate-binding domain-containing protein [Lophiostoma macrostomum CBS 122681]|uniref:Iron-sulfur cluster assembly factor IBA57 homolog, mitochondrial n=1 Tax=Lophiostoma macrostomum CBS 122681 TaxID=1314788 RepID=A0A6A6SLU9_9PLEO|nr:Aminomethyltransferase folate-binding domain-containing protein [Lophiostoma macrostomum CBS 122681]